MIQPVDYVLASVYHKDPENLRLATAHARRLITHPNVFLEPIDKRLWQYIKGYVQKDRIAPSEKIVQALAEKDMAMDVVERLATLHNIKICEEQEFLHFLGSAYQSVKDRACQVVLSTASQILSGNYSPPKGQPQLSGFQDTVKFLLQKSMDFRKEDSRGKKLRGNIREEGAEMIKRYEWVKANQQEAVGILTGIDCVDLKTLGIKKGDLWLVAGFTSDGKTTLCLNIAHQAVCSGHNVLYASMEMGRETIRDILYCIHSGHKMFTNMHPALDLEKITSGRLTEEEENFYVKHVIDDFENNPTYGVLEVVQPDCVWSAEILQAEAEMLHERLPGGLDLVIPDYVGLMQVEGRSEGRNEDLNKLIREMKQMCLTFDGGNQISVLSPFQCNREGQRRAAGLDSKEMKKGAKSTTVEYSKLGEYDLQALSSAHEAERSSDVILSVFMNEELRRNGTLVLCQLKGRNTGCISPTRLHAQLSSRIIRENQSCIASFEESDFMDNFMALV